MGHYKKEGTAIHRVSCVPKRSMCAAICDLEIAILGSRVAGTLILRQFCDKLPHGTASGGTS